MKKRRPRFEVVQVSRLRGLARWEVRFRTAAPRQFLVEHTADPALETEWQGVFATALAKTLMQMAAERMAR